MRAIQMKMLDFGALLADADSTTLPSSEAEAALHGALAAGQEDAMATAYKLHRQAVWAFARRLVGEDAAADDLVHEVFVRLPRAMRSYRGGASLRTFLISIAINHARHHVRAATRRRAASAKLARSACDTQAFSDPVERQQLAAALSRALDSLPLDQRVAFVLCHAEERSVAEAASLVGASENTMRARVFHARRKLRAALAQWRPFESAAARKEGGQ